MKSRNIMISLCDYSGIMAQPWLEGGYMVILVDPRHPRGVRMREDNYTMTIGEKIDDSDTWNVLRTVLQHGTAAFMAAFPPCTNLAVSGAAHWAAKSENDLYFQHRAMGVVHECRVIGELLGCPYMIENPVSAISSMWREPDHSFDPCDYTAYCPEDNYTKKTMLWTGGGFIMPAPHRLDYLDPPVNRTHQISGPERGAFRSITPKGFATAVYERHCEF